MGKILTSKRQFGIALISVLLVFIILSWVVSFFLAQTNNHLDLMGNIKNRVIAEIEADSLVDEIYFMHIASNYRNKTGYENWNYRGKTFSPSEALKITIQDSQGKLQLDGLDKAMLSRFLIQQGAPEDQVMQFKDCLEDWEDQDSYKRVNGGEEDWYTLNGLLPPRNGKIQTVSELEAICGFPKEHKEVLFNNILLTGAGSFSPLFTSNTLLWATMLPDDRKQTLLELREQEEDKQIDRVYNQNSNEIGSYQYNVSDVLELKLQYKLGKVVAKRNVVISHRLGYNPRPIIQYWHWSE